jgi:AraC family transcriptional regulator
LNQTDNRIRYIARINRAIDFIDTNLDQELTLDQVARFSGFSEFHFHRIFSNIGGETFGRFVQRVRVERSAIMLANDSKKSITDVAYACGFSSSASYSRLFKDFFSCTPSQWRSGEVQNSRISIVQGKNYHIESTPPKDIHISSLYNRSMNSFEWKITLKGEEFSRIRIESYPEREIAYIRHIGPYVNNEPLFCSLFEKLFRWAVPRKVITEDTRNYCIYHDDPAITDPEKLRLSVGVDIPAGTEISGEVGRMVLPRGEYAVARLELSSDKYPLAWNIIYRDWLPESGYMCGDGLPYETMLQDPAEHPEGKHVFEICIPVVPL